MTASGTLATVVLAAGAGRRFGGAKQLAPIDGEPALGRVLGAVEGFGSPQVVVLGAHAELVAPLLEDGGWGSVVAPDWEQGPGASLRAGLAAMPEADEVLIVLGDLPWLDREAVRLVLAAAEDDVEAVRAYEGDRPGHPLLLRGTMLAAAREAPDEGMRPLLATTEVRRVACDGLGVAEDLDRPIADTPEGTDFAAEGSLRLDPRGGRA